MQKTGAGMCHRVSSSLLCQGFPTVGRASVSQAGWQAAAAKIQAPVAADLHQFRYRKFHFRYRLSESYHFRYRFLPLSLQGPIVTGIRTMERSYLCTYTMNVPTLRTFTRACSLLKTFSSSKLPSEALQFLPTIVTGNRYRDTYCYRK